MVKKIDVHLYKYAATAEALRRVALENGIIPGVGKKWKIIAKRLVKQLSKKHPAKRSIDEILPEKKHWENIAKIDNYYAKKHNMLDREFSGGVDKDFAVVSDIGTHKTVNVSALKNLHSFHKHPGIAPAPSREDVLFLKNELWAKPKGAVATDYIFTSNSRARGLTSYSVKKIGDDKYTARLNFLYRRDPKNFDLNGRYKLKEGNKIIAVDMNGMKNLNNAEFRDHLLNEGLNANTASGRKKLYKKYNEPLEAEDKNLISYTENVFPKAKRSINRKKN